MIPDIVQYEHGRVLSLSWLKKDNSEEDVVGATITGVIESIPGPEYTIRPISGALDATYNPFTWTLHYDDTYIDGNFTVQFRAVFPDTKEIRSIPTPVKIIRSVEWP